MYFGERGAAMENRIRTILAQLKESQGISVPEFAERCGLQPTTIYSVRKKDSMDKIQIDTFLKIAHGLGMTAEELYYGEAWNSDNQAATDRPRSVRPPSPLSSDEERLVRAYRDSNAQGRRTILGVADLQAGMEGQSEDARRRAV